MFATNTFMEIQWWGEFTIPFLSPLFPPENRQKINNIYFFEHLILAFVNSVPVSYTHLTLPTIRLV